MIILFRFALNGLTNEQYIKEINWTNADKPKA